MRQILFVEASPGMETSVLGFMGIQDVEVIRVEGTGRSALAAKAMQIAENAIEAVAA